MDLFDDNNWDLIDYSSFIDDVSSATLYWNDSSAAAPNDASLAVPTEQDNECVEKECPQKNERREEKLVLKADKTRMEQQLKAMNTASTPTFMPPRPAAAETRNDSCSKVGSKACRERQRRERLNDRFLELSSTLEPGRPATNDKLAILGDAIRVLNQLKAESQEYKDTNGKLLEEIKTLKAEKNELREEKLVLKGDKTRMEQQMKAMNTAPTPTFMPPHPAAGYPGGANKMPVYPSYGFVPMWQYLPPAARDTSHDHELRPPAA